MRLITLYVDDYYLKKLKKLVDEGKYPNRAEIIRFAIRDLIRTEA